MEVHDPIESSTVPLWRIGVFAIVWNALVWPNAYVVWLRLTDRGQIGFVDAVVAHPWVCLWLIFPIIALVSAFRAIRLGISAALYHRSLLTMSSGPATIGGSLDAVIRAPGLQLRDGQHIRLTLKCRVDQTRTDFIDTGLPPGSQGAVVTTDKWKNEWVVPRNTIRDVDGAALIPVRVTIPSTCSETGKVPSARNRTNQITWWLSARAEPRHLWDAAFEVPVVGARI